MTTYEKVEITANETYTENGTVKKDKLGYIEIDSIIGTEELDTLIEAINNCYKFTSNPVVLDINTTVSSH